MGLVWYCLAVVALLQCAGAQSTATTTHVVGDTLGWVIPPGGAVAYTTWAATQTFKVGDTLVFNFANGLHNVVEVTKASYDACDTANQIGSVVTTSPARIRVDEAGEHYYICGVGGHCSLGQKLAINVTSAAASPPAPVPTLAPAPKVAATAPKVATPAPSPKTHVVGDSLGWTIPPGGPIAYTTWASLQTFAVGDTLLFNFTNQVHNVVEVTKAAYGTCNTNTTLGTPVTNSPARITLKSPGEHFYVCTVGQHCMLGQKLAINVTGKTTTASSPSPSTMSTTGTAPAPSTTTVSPPSKGTTISNNSSPSGAPSPMKGTGPNSAASSLVVSSFSFTLVLSIVGAFLL